MNGPPAETADRMGKDYVELFGRVPALVEQRVAMAELTRRLDTIEMIEAVRKVLISANPLGSDRQQLVHFGQLVVLGNRDAASRHAVACRKNGATAEELIGVVETAFITAGVPAYNLGIEILHELFIMRGEAAQPDPEGRR
jgi:4-carboxymuconolactone decarboxylase